MERMMMMRDNNVDAESSMPQWNFEPKWLSQSNGVFDDLSTCPSWMTLDNTTHKSKSKANHTSTMQASRYTTQSGENDSMRATNLHIKAQNMRLRSSLSDLKNKIAELETENQGLRDHVNLLRHISEPTMDAGALDASLAILRGCELEQSRQKLADSKKVIAALTTAREQLQLDLDNERQEWIQKETSFQAEINRLNLYMSRIGALHSANGHNVEHMRLQMEGLKKNHEDTVQQLKTSHEKQLTMAKKHDETLRESEIRKLDEQIQALEEDKFNLQHTLNEYTQKFREQEQSLELAWAHVDGMQVFPREVNVSGELEKQRATLMKSFDQERVKLQQEINRLSKLVNQEPLSHTCSMSTQTGNTGSGSDFTEKLMSYHAQLKRATVELKQAALDYDSLFGRFVASQAAIAALHRPSGPEDDFDILKDLATSWEKRAQEVEYALAIREREFVSLKAASCGALYQLDSQNWRFHEYVKTLEETYAHQEASMKTEYTDHIKQLETDLHDLRRDKRVLQVEVEKSRAALEKELSQRAIIEADLAVAENEVSRMAAELARKKEIPTMISARSPQRDHTPLSTPERPETVSMMDATISPAQVPRRLYFNKPIMKLNQATHLESSSSPSPWNAQDSYKRLQQRVKPK